MTYDDYIKKVNKQITNLQRLQITQSAVMDVKTMIDKRVFKDGLRSDNVPIGRYGGKPFYLSPDSSPVALGKKEKKTQTFLLKGKNGNTKFKNGKPHKTAYFQDYGAYRRATGRQTNTIDLRYTADLQKDFGASMQVLNGNWVLGTNRRINTVKMLGNEKRFGVIFDLSNKEKTYYITIVKKNILKIYE
jgi:hypothetical protein